MRLYVGFLLFLLLFVGLNILLLDNLRKVWSVGYPIVLLIINLDLLILVVVFAMFFRKFIKTYLSGRKGRLRVKISNALFFYVIVPVIFLNMAVAVVLVQYTKTMITSPLKDIYVKAESLGKRVEGYESSKARAYREFFRFVVSSGNNPQEYAKMFEDVRSVQRVKECRESATDKEYTLCVENYAIIVRRDEEIIRTLSAIKDTAQELRRVAKSRDLITGIHVYFIVFITFIIFLASVWFANLLARYISLPIERLSQKTREIAKGNFDVSLDVPRRDDEMDVLTDSFIKMKEELKHIYRRLEKEKEILKRLIEVLPVGIAYFPEGEPPVVNDAFRHLSGSEVGENLEERLKSKTNLRLERMRIGGGLAYVVYDIQPYILSERFKTWQYAVKRIAHEIKNPLTPISLNLERIAHLLEKEEVDKERVRASIEIMLAEIERIRRLINQFRSLSAHETANFQPVELRSFFEDLKKLYSTLDINVEGDKRVMADIDLLKDMFMNLFNNSIEWQAKRVWIRIKEDELLYSDDGRGIGEGMEELIFLPYQSENPQGFGLGLSIVKHIAHMHGWSVEALRKERGFHLAVRFSQEEL